jgi:hypothetical protein
MAIRTFNSIILSTYQQSFCLVFVRYNSSLFDEFVCKLGLFWHAWAIWLGHMVCRVCRATCTSPLVELIFRSFVCNKWSFYYFIGVIVRFVPMVRFPTADLVSLFQQLSYFNRFLKQTFLSYRCFLTA